MSEGKDELKGILIGLMLGAAMSDETGKVKGMLRGLMLGAAVGTVLGILIAPEAGSETQRKLKNALGDISEKTKRTTAQMKDFIRRKKEEIEEEQETAA